MECSRSHFGTRKLGNYLCIFIVSPSSFPFISRGIPVQIVCTVAIKGTFCVDVGSGVSSQKVFGKMSIHFVFCVLCGD